MFSLSSKRQLLPFLEILTRRGMSSGVSTWKRVVENLVRHQSGTIYL